MDKQVFKLFMLGLHCQDLPKFKLLQQLLSLISKPIGYKCRIST
jgi:hypothetical protein